MQSIYDTITNNSSHTMCLRAVKSEKEIGSCLLPPVCLSSWWNSTQIEWQAKQTHATSSHWVQYWFSSSWRLNERREKEEKNRIRLFSMKNMWKYHMPTRPTARLILSVSSYDRIHIHTLTHAAKQIHSSAESISWCSGCGGGGGDGGCVYVYAGDTSAYKYISNKLHRAILFSRTTNVYLHVLHSSGENLLERENFAPFAHINLAFGTFIYLIFIRQLIIYYYFRFDCMAPSRSSPSGKLTNGKKKLRWQAARAGPLRMCRQV